ncbi:alpha/beta fold hydrolase [Streptomyces sp. NPDC087440]|uniref:alpha/beta fold hydrolase n=1 Tax=Streptomyces sp. NPDC087440 TaxID=3365790 RepID=UPI003800008D
MGASGESRRGRVRRVIRYVIGLTLALALAACGGGSGGSGGKDTASSAPPPVPAPKADWKDCPLTGQPTRECATLKVPIDAAKPGSGTLGLAVSRLPATDKRRRIGALVMDPGGPGLPGLYTTAALLPPQIRALYDVVGFDRRGSGKSTPVDCGEPGGAIDKLGSEGEFADLEKADPAAVERDAKAYVTKCRAKYGELLAHLGTADTVSDLESMRLALGEEKLSLLMVSYGTVVAQDYLRTHPDRVRAAVLDGTVDTSESGVLAALGSDATEDEASGTAGKTEEQKKEAQIRAQTAGFREWCTASGPAECAVAPKPEDALATVSGRDRDTLAKAADAVMVVPSDWPGFSRALDKAADAAPGDRAAYADLRTYADKGFPKDVAAALKHPGTPAAFELGVKCADFAWPKTTAGLLKEVAEEAKAKGAEGSAAYYAAFYSPCAVWPRGGPTLGEIRAGKAPRPLILNAEKDVRTTLAEAEKTAKTLPASLLKVGGQVHGLAQSGNPCVNTAVVKTLVDGATPKDGTCPEN